MASLGTFSGGGLSFGMTFTLVDGFSMVADAITNRMRGLDATADAISTSIRGAFADIAIGAGLVYAGVKLLSPIFNAVEEAGKFENTKIAFQTMLGSAEAMKKVIAEINEFAVKTPFSLPLIEQSYKRLLAYGVDVKDIKQDFNAIGNIASGLGGGGRTISQVLDTLIYAFGKVRATGYLTGRDMRMMTEQGLAVREILAGIGIDISKHIHDVGKMGITFEQLEQAILKAGGAGGKFDNLMEKLSGTVPGLLNNIGDYWIRISRNIGIAIEPLTKPILQAALTVLAALSGFIETKWGKIAVMLGIAAIALLAFTVISAGLMVIWAKIGATFAVAFAEVWATLLPLIAELLPFIALIWLLYAAWQAFDDVLTLNADRAKEGTWLSFLQKTGAVLRGVWEIIKSVNDAGYKLPEEVDRMIKAMGVDQIVLEIGYWIERVRAFFIGMWEGASEAFTFIWGALSKFIDWIVQVLEWFGLFNNSVGDAQTALETWAEVGRWAGGILVAVLAMITINSIYAAIAQVAAFWEVYLIIALVIGLVWALYYIFRAIGDFASYTAEQWRKGMENMQEAWDAVKSFFSYLLGILSNVGGAIMNAGKNIINKFLDGIKEGWQGVMGWFKDHVPDILHFFVDPSSVFRHPETTEKLYEHSFIKDYQAKKANLPEANSPSSRNPVIVYPQPGVQQPVPIILHNHFEVDSVSVATAVKNRNDIDAAR